MVSTGEVRKGQTLIIEGELYKVMEANHVNRDSGHLAFTAPLKCDEVLARVSPPGAVVFC